jgi:hypothetical protein
MLGDVRIQRREGGLELLSYRGHEGLGVPGLRQGGLILLAAWPKIVRESLVRIPEALGALAPDLFAPHLLPSRRAHADLVTDAVNPPWRLLVVHEVVPGLLHDPVEWYVLFTWKGREGAVPLPLQHLKRLHHGTLDVIVATKV